MQYKLTPAIALLISILNCGVSLAAESASFDSAGVQLHYYVAGEGETVLLLHGFSGSAQTAWIAPGNFEALAAAGFRVVALDQRGHGASGKPHDPAMYGVTMADDIGRLLHHLDVEQAHIVGYSMGARIANTFRSRYPWRIRTLTLGGYGWPWSGTTMTVEEARAALANRDIPAGNDLDALAAYRARAHEHVPSREALQANRIPVLSIVGTEDTVVSRADVESLRTTMPNVTAVDLPGTHAGADGLLYKPEFAAAVIRFIETRGRRREQ